MYRYGFLPGTDFTCFGPFMPYAPLPPHVSWASCSLYFLFSLRAFSPRFSFLYSSFPVLPFSCRFSIPVPFFLCVFPPCQNKKRPPCYRVRPISWRSCAPSKWIFSTAHVSSPTRFFPALPFLHTPFPCTSFFRASFPAAFLSPCFSFPMSKQKTPRAGFMNCPN